MRLHGIVIFDRRRVNLADPMRGRFGCPPLARRIGRLAIDLAGGMRLRARRGEIEQRGLLAVVRLDAGRRRGGLLLSRGHDDRDRLAVVMHEIVLQQTQDPAGRRIHARASALGQRRRIGVRDDEHHAGHLRGLRRVEARDAAVRDRGQHERRMRHARQLHVADVSRLAHHFRGAIDAIDPGTDQIHVMPPRGRRQPARRARARGARVRV